MSRQRKIVCFTLGVIPVICDGFLGLPGWGYEVETHQGISQEAVRSSSVQSTVRDSLGIDSGIEARLKDGKVEKTIQGWVVEGSKREDDYTTFPSGRFRNHFHHPLRSWGNAGLSDTFAGQSSVVWAQTRAQPAAMTGSWSWQETRDRFALALTSALQKDRDRWLAQTFRGLGHQVHLIQDAASVPHARNESHVTGFSLESWTRERF